MYMDVDINIDVDVEIDYYLVYMVVILGKW